MAIELHADDAGSRCTLRVGERVTVRLPENPTTGYRWVLEHDPSALALADDSADIADAPRGAGGERVLVFEAARTGLATLSLAKRRSWESGEPAETFSVELDVQAGQ